MKTASELPQPRPEARLSVSLPPLAGAEERPLAGLREAIGAWKRDTRAGEEVSQALSQWAASWESLRPRIRFAPERYQRQRIYRDSDFEALLLCWEEAQATPIHDHGAQSGWFAVLEGSLIIEEFERRGRPPDLRSVAFGEGLPPGSLRLQRRRRLHVPAGLTVCEAAAPETIHRVSSDGGRAVSLHVYSKPLDSFLVFDEAGACRRLRLHS